MLLPPGQNAAPRPGHCLGHGGFFIVAVQHGDALHGTRRLTAVQTAAQTEAHMKGLLPSSRKVDAMQIPGPTSMYLQWCTGTIRSRTQGWRLTQRPHRRACNEGCTAAGSS